MMANAAGCIIRSTRVTICWRRGLSRLWRAIESERETAYLLKSQTVKERLLQAAQRQTGLSFEAAVEKLGI
jgi:hypothetical protein